MRTSIFLFSNGVAFCLLLPQVQTVEKSATEINYIRERTTIGRPVLPRKNLFAGFSELISDFPPPFLTSHLVVWPGLALLSFMYRSMAGSYVYVVGSYVSM